MSSYYSPTLHEVRTAVIRPNDSSQPLLGIRWTNRGKDASDPLYKATITIQPTSGSGTKLRILLKEYEQSPTTGNVTLRTTHTFDGATTLTLGALVAAINAIEGFKAYRLNAAADYSLNSASFIAQSETSIRPLVLQEVLHRDASAFTGAAANWAVRVGVPEAFDGGKIKLLFVKANIASTTDCTVRISTDPSDTDASKEILRFTKSVPDATQTDLYDFHQNPVCVRGPLLVELISTGGIDEDTANTPYELLVTYQNAEV